MKIAFIGGVHFSLELLSEILSKGWDVSVVFSYDDSKKKFFSDMTSFSEITKKFGIKHVVVDNINDKENIQILNKISPDLILVMGWSQLLGKEIINIPPLGVIGSHPTELPKYRGRAPIPWTILKNLKKSALTFFYIKEGIDDGDILDQQFFSVDQDDDANTLYKKIIVLGKTMILKNLHEIKTGNITKVKQDPSKFIENWPKRKTDDGKINWNDSAENIHRLIRATTFPYLGAFTYFKNKKLIIWRSSFSESNNLVPGKIYLINNSIIIGTGSGSLQILKATYDNKNDLNKIFTSNNVGIILQ